MILVGEVFDYGTMRQNALVMDIDSDRKAAAFVDGTGAILLVITNGAKQTKVSLTREAAEAVALVLADTLSEMYDETPPTSEGEK